MTPDNHLGTGDRSMGLPQSPQDDDFETFPAKRVEPPRSVERPDWLTDADTGAADEAVRAGEGAPGLERPRLLSLVPKKPEPEAEPGAEAGAEPERPAPVRWAPAASSVPTLRIRQAPAAAPAPASASVDSPPDADLTEVSDLAGYLDDGTEVTKGATVAPVRTLAPLEEPWWIVAADALRHDWRLQAGLGGVLVAIAAFVLWPRSSPSVSLGTIRHHPDQYNGRAVTVHGRVGDVFRMGGGYTFYLEQGHESIVVFTRSRVPVSREELTIKGSISTGYLDGIPRPTLFEATP
jgi:hypothetical protein